MLFRFQQMPACGKHLRTRLRASSRSLGLICLAVALAPALGNAAENKPPAGLSEQNLPLQQPAPSEALQASLSIGYESLYVSSGMQGAYGSLQTNAELAWGGFTAGVWGNNPLDVQDSNPAGPFGPEYRFYGNYEVALTEDVSASLGFTYYWHPRKGSTPNRQREINLGVMADTLLSPELVYNYDFDLQQHDVALGISHEESLDPWLPLEGFGVAAGVVFGYLHADRPESDQMPSPQDSMGYIYTEIAINLTYVHKENLGFYVGPRFSSNDSNTGNIADRRSNFWWGMGCNIAF